jgi:hypothetical protein
MMMRLEFRQPWLLMLAVRAWSNSRRAFLAGFNSGHMKSLFQAEAGTPVLVFTIRCMELNLIGNPT